jgi:integrase
MARQRTGRVFERKRWLEEGRARRKGEKAQWYAFLKYPDSDTGKLRVEKRSADSKERLFLNKTEAQNWLDERLRELKTHGARSLKHSEHTFEDLATLYEKTRLIEPQYVDGRKVEGLRSYKTQKRFLATLRRHFDNRQLRSITASLIEKYKTDRLATRKRPKKGEKIGGQRSIASVNRELALLRSMLNFAHDEGWILKNPFKKGLISIADERRRERIITRAEEARLLGACSKRQAHLKPILICALDTGMRRGEILKLKWADVDFVSSTLIVRAFNTKTMQERQLAMTDRLKLALGALYELSTKEPDKLCFGVEDNVKKSFDTVRKAAGLPDVRFHDLRHTAASRLVTAHMPLSEVGRILGHTQPKTTYRYVNANAETAQRAATILDAFNAGESLESPLVQ